ncbi:hypothetical protein AN958_06015 [Leucoagaricus sp. SymC.cos]|nr:hypothetical protein AN958_06015 [Leucoagaricus sp. SymC.cos]
MRTGAVHDIIEKARGRDGFPGNNLVAVRKVWKRNQESLNDGLDEVRETMENAEKPEDGVGKEEEEFDDGWTELGISSNVKPSVTEVGRIKKMYTIVRLSTLLHQRIFKDALSTLSPSLPLNKDTHTMLDSLADGSSDFLTCSDNFISTMYPPQVAEHMDIELEEYRQQLSNLQSKFDPLIPETSIEEQLQKLRLSSSISKPTDHYTKLRKWYIACINQINKNIYELEHELKGSESPLA